MQPPADCGPTHLGQGAKSRDPPPSGWVRLVELANTHLFSRATSESLACTVSKMTLMFLMALFCRTRRNTSMPESPGIMTSRMAKFGWRVRFKRNNHFRTVSDEDAGLSQLSHAINSRFSRCVKLPTPHPLSLFHPIPIYRQGGLTRCPLHSRPSS